MQRLNYDTPTRVVNATAAGVTAINSTSVDMQDFETVVFEVSMGTLTATQVTSVKAQGSADNATFADIAGLVTGNALDADSNKLLLLEVYRPHHRYLRSLAHPPTPNAAITTVTPP